MQEILRKLWTKAKPLAGRLRSWASRRRWWLTGVGVIWLLWLFSFPGQLFDAPYSSVLLDREGNLLGARIASDGQWRFPVQDSVPEKFEQAILTFEDKRFYTHPGVDPIALGRALWLNLTHGEVLSGGSTLSMQVIRLSRPGKPRSIWQKVIEVWLATRLEWKYSKEEILALYAAHAPFGGNVVGLETAAWRYMGRSSRQLSWAEAATLAVLPNAPGLIHPGRNRDALRDKRNRLLGMMLEAAIIDSLEWDLALEEPLPDEPLAIPNAAPHLLERARTDHRGEGQLFHTTLDAALQERANDLIARHHRRLSANGIHNAALLVAETRTGAVRAYVGNTPGTDPSEGHAVDVVTAPRSTGSILKPLLYASMLNEGELLPGTLVPDVPSYYDGFSPSNYDKQFHGAVHANEALARSLNIPAVRMLHQHGVQRFQQELETYGLTTLFRPPDDYGLSLILGGAEAKLWDLASAYAGMSRILENYVPYNGRYDRDPFQPLTYLSDKVEAPLTDEDRDEMVEVAALSAGSVWHTFQAMVEVSRPGEEASWRQFGSASRVAWKTGTSYGFRDAWAIGVKPGYVVAVWVGNADGEGRPGLIGSEAAAPILFDMLSALPASGGWFREPYDDLVEAPVCRSSGHLSGEFCPEVDTMRIPARGVETSVCPYHELVFLTRDGRYRVHSDCESVFQMRIDSMFVLPPQQEVYYRREHPQYRPIPPWRGDCLNQMPEARSPLSIVYPLRDAKVYLPVQLDGSVGEFIAEAAHRRESAELFWHLDGEFLGTTCTIHQKVLRPLPGHHELTLVDEEGNEASCEFDILREE